VGRSTHSGLVDAEILGDSIHAYDILGSGIPKRISVNVDPTYTPSSGSVGWAFYNPDNVMVNNGSENRAAGNYEKYDLVTPEVLQPCYLHDALVAGGTGVAQFLIGENRNQSGLMFDLYDSPQMISDGMQIPANTNAWTIWDAVQKKQVLGIPSACEESQ
jgi:hypothetical protein